MEGVELNQELEFEHYLLFLLVAKFNLSDELDAYPIQVILPLVILFKSFVFYHVYRVLDHDALALLKIIELIAAKDFKVFWPVLLV
jgi:hypothetical protein